MREARQEDELRELKVGIVRKSSL